MRGFNLIIRENSYFLSKFWTSSLTGQIKTEFKVKNCWSGPFTKSLSIYVYVCLFALLACLFLCLFVCHQREANGKWKLLVNGPLERCTFWKGEKRADENWATYVLTKKPFHKILIIAASHVQFWTENSGLGQIEIVFGWSNSPNCWLVNDWFGSFLHLSDCTYIWGLIQDKSIDIYWQQWQPKCS